MRSRTWQTAGARGERGLKARIAALEAKLGGVAAAPDTVSMKTDG